jgi:hypothetical protein
MMRSRVTSDGRVIAYSLARVFLNGSLNFKYAFMRRNAIAMCRHVPPSAAPRRPTICAGTRMGCAPSVLASVPFQALITRETPPSFGVKERETP